MKIVALTGNVASGKSAVARRWEDLGVPVLRADDLARRVVEPGTPGLRQVAEAFGADVLQEDGSLDRGRMRARITGNPSERRRLEGILHPLIEEERQRWLEECREEGRSMVVCEIPLLFERDLQEAFPVVVVVHASDEARLERLIRDRGMEEGEARALMATQDPPGPKREAADHVVTNDGTLEELQTRADEVLSRLADQDTHPEASAGGRG